MLSLSYQRRVAAQRRLERATQVEQPASSVTTASSSTSPTASLMPFVEMEMDQTIDGLVLQHRHVHPHQNQPVEPIAAQDDRNGGDDTLATLNLRQEEQHEEQRQAIDALVDTKSLPFRFASALSLRQKQTKFVVLQHQQEQQQQNARYGPHRSHGRVRKKRLSKNCEFIRRLIRERQRELRENQRQHELEQEILALNAVIAQLERNQTLAESRSTTFRMNRSAVAVDLLGEYFHLFERGYDPTDGTRTLSNARAQEFANATMEPHLVCREYRGVDKLLRQWQKYTKYHSGLEFVLNSVVLVEEEEEIVSIRGLGEVRLRISMDTLRYLYPAVLEAGNELLVDALLGKVYVLPVDKVFHFNRDGKVFAHESKVDLVSSILDLVKDPFAAMKVVNASVLTEDGHWKTVHEDCELQDTMNELSKMLL